MIFVHEDGLEEAVPDELCGPGSHYCMGMRWGKVSKAPKDGKYLFLQVHGTGYVFIGRFINGAWEASRLAPIGDTPVEMIPIWFDDNKLSDAAIAGWTFIPSDYLAFVEKDRDHILGHRQTSERPLQVGRV
jgi:hypothetical protein